jgi:hypothetical protein
MENPCIENPNGMHMILCPLYTWKAFSLKKTKISIFGGISKFLKLIVFGQIFTILGSFRQFWANLGRLAKLVMVGSMPKLRLKS